MGYGGKGRNPIQIVGNGNDPRVGDLSNLETTDKSSVVNAVNEVSEHLAETMKYPLGSFETQSDVIRTDLPYFHVDRYGAQGDYNPTSKTGTDDTQAIQKAVNSAIAVGGGIILFDYKKKYLQSGTVYINCDSVIPIYLSGGMSGTYRGSVIYKETTGDFYYVNTNADGSSYLDPSTQYYHFGVENLTFQSATLTANNGFTMFRTRSRFKNVISYGLDRLVNQQTTDSNGNANYCDQSVYRNITINYPKIGGLALSKPDGSIIEQFNVFYPQSTCGSYIIVWNGNSFSISNCVFAMHLTNNGVSVSDSSAYIKLSGVETAVIHDVYIERTHMSNAIYIGSSNNIKVYAISERYEGNNLISISNSDNVDIELVYRNATLVSGYCDVYFAGTNTNISIKKFRIRDYTTQAKRNISLQGTLPTFLLGELVKLGVYYDGTTWHVVDHLGNDLSSIFGAPAWSSNNDGVEFPTTSLVRNATVISVTPRYAGASIMPFVPVINVPSTNRIGFYDQSSGTRTQTQGTKMNCNLTISIPMAM